MCATCAHIFVIASQNTSTTAQSPSAEAVRLRALKAFLIKTTSLEIFNLALKKVTLFRVWRCVCVRVRVRLDSEVRSSVCERERGGRRERQREWRVFLCECV